MKNVKVVHWDLETLPDPEKIYDVIPSIGAWPGRTFKAELQSIMCFGYKIEGEDEAKCLNIWDYTDDFQNDAPLVHLAYEILQDADEIVTHNGKQFDLKVLNTRLAKWGLPPLPKINHVDTKTVCKRHLSLYSNSLASVAKFFGLSNKMTFGDKWGMWKRIAFNRHTKHDLKVMEEYCKQDVNVLQEIYHRLRPFHGKQAVNKTLVFDDGTIGCPICQSKKVVSNGNRGGYKRIQCTKCGSWSQLNKKETLAKAI